MISSVSVCREPSQNKSFQKERTVAEFLVPDLGEYSRLWHRVVVPARQATWTGGPVRQQFGVDYIPRSETKSLASVFLTAANRNEIPARGPLAGIGSISPSSVDKARISTVLTSLLLFLLSV